MPPANYLQIPSQMGAQPTYIGQRSQLPVLAPQAPQSFPQASQPSYTLPPPSSSFIPQPAYIPQSQSQIPYQPQPSQYMQQSVPPQSQQTVIHHAAAQAMYNPYQQISHSHPCSVAPSSTYLPQSTPILGAPQPSPLNTEWEEMKVALKAIQGGNDPKTFKFETLCPYPFDRAITMIPFPKHFEIPKFDKFRGKGDPVTHIKEFYMHCQEVVYNDAFLLRLFPKSLAGLALEWFYRIPYGTIHSFAELSEAFVAQYAHLVETELSIVDLVHTKKKGGESLAEYLQRWQTLTTRIYCTLPERHLVKMLIDNAHPSLAHHMTMNCLKTYKDIK